MIDLPSQACPNPVDVERHFRALFPPILENAPPGSSTELARAYARVGHRLRDAAGRAGIETVTLLVVDLDRLLSVAPATTLQRDARSFFACDDGELIVDGAALDLTPQALTVAAEFIGCNGQLHAHRFAEPQRVGIPLAAVRGATLRWRDNNRSEEWSTGTMHLLHADGSLTYSHEHRLSLPDIEYAALPCPQFPEEEPPLVPYGLDLVHAGLQNGGVFCARITVARGEHALQFCAKVTGVTDAADGPRMRLLICRDLDDATIDATLFRPAQKRVGDYPAVFFAPTCAQCIDVRECPRPGHPVSWPAFFRIQPRTSAPTL